MNANIRYLIFLALTILVFSQTVAQKANYTTNSGMLIGFGFGGSYQQSDVINSRGAGFDFTLGHSIYKKENAFFSIDWKFRFLAGENQAFDHRINLDSTYNNVHLDVINCDLEFGLTFNRLREITRIVITGFAGAGMTYGSTSTDLYDANSLIYDYSVINPNQSRSKVHADLVKLSDGNFETHLVNRAALMPTLGIFIGYQFSPSFMLGIEHKTNFSLSEQNSWDGINIDNKIMPGSKLDRIHYTTLCFRWNLRGRSSRPASSYTYSNINNTQPANKAIETTEPIPNPPPVRTVYPPVVDITVPAGNNYSTTEEKIDITAKVQNVTSRQDIQVVLNGNNVGFEYDPGTGSIRTTLVLADGQNNLVITGTNPAGSARDNVTINFNKPVRTALPVIRFINPPDPVTVDRSIFELSVQTINVRAWQDVTVTINGIKTNNFNLNTEGVVTTNVGLKEGANRIEVSGKNESGSAQEHTTITYVKPATETRPIKETKPVTETRPCPQPFLRMISPVQNDQITENQSFNFRFEVKNIFSKDQLHLTLNSKNIYDFNFAGSELTCTASLISGTNSFELVAKNNCGTVTVTSSIIYKPAEPVKETVTVQQPKPCSAPGLNFSVNAINQSDATHELKGSVSNVKDRSEITITINNTPYEGFQFVPNAGVLGARFKFNPGTYVIKVNVKNECGQASGSDTLIIQQPKPCPGPGLKFNVDAINQNDGTHELKGTLSNVKDRSGIAITINGTPYDGFQFVTGTGVLDARFKFDPGIYIIKVNIKNECGQASGSDTVIIKEESPCGPRINPGNSQWEFCLVTPTDTFNRENLTSSNFSYSGRATSLFIMPIAGGGDAIVNGKPYSLRSGQYYLFTGNLTVKVSTKNPGSMGHWSVCVTSDKEPVYGNGNNRPKSPCEETKDESTSKKTGPSLDNKTSKDTKPSTEVKKDTTKTTGQKTGGKK